MVDRGRRLPGQEAATMLAQVQRPYVVSARAQMVEQVAVEDVVRPAVPDQDGLAGPAADGVRRLRRPVDQGRYDRALAVAAEIEPTVGVPVPEDRVGDHDRPEPPRSRSWTSSRL